jgi:hypothetical protein
MRVGIVLGVVCVVALFSGSAAFATDYHWTAGAVSKSYSDTTAWTPTGFPGGAADALYMDNTTGTTTNASTVTLPASGTVTFGKVQVDNGVFSPYGSTGTIRVQAGSGQNGDLIIRKKGQLSGYGGDKTFDVDGNVYFQYGVYTSFTSYSLGYSSLVMRGTGKTLDILQDYASDQSWKSVTISDCASISSVRKAVMKDLLINGTITGGDWAVGPKGTASPSVIKFGPNGAWTGGKLFIINVATADLSTPQYVDLGGGTYPQIEVDAPNSYYSRQTIRLKGNVTTTSDFSFMKSIGYYATSMQALLDTDNGSGKISNLTIGGNLDMDGAVVNNATHYAGIRGRTATISVSGSATFGRYAYLKGDCSTWKIGGDVNFTTNFRFDNTDMKQTTMILNGTGARTLTPRTAIFGNIDINKTGGGSVALGGAAGDMLQLTGNFSVDCGTFTPGGRYVYMMGGKNTQATAENLTMATGSLDKLWVAAGSPTFVQLQTNITVTSALRIDNGCAIVLNNHTLTVAGSPIPPGNYDLGKVYATWADVSPIPEPGTMVLIGTGLLGVLRCARRRRSS